jgi:hypothetical protein
VRLFVDFDLMSSDTGPSGAVYALLRRAGHRPDLEYVSGRGRAVTPPVLVTDTGEVIAGVSPILRWLADGDHAR